MTSAVMSQRCPNCGETIPIHAGYSPWCDHCNWNLDPAPSHPPANPLDALYRKLGEASTETLFTEAADLKSLRPRLTLTKGVAFALASTVYLIFGVLIVVGLFFLIKGWPNPFAIVAGIICLGMVWVLRPRPPHVEHTLVLQRDGFPTLYRTVWAVQQQLGGRPAHAIIVDGSFNASLGQIGWRRKPLMTLGLPLWSVLENGERLALLAHEAAHEVNADVLRGLFVGNAIQILLGWRQFLRPERVIAWDHGLAGVAAAPLNLGLVMLAGLAWGMASLLCHLLWRDAQRAEYYADALGASVAGSESMIGLLRKMHLCRVFDGSVQNRALSRERDGDLFAELRARADAVSPRELERLRRVEQMTNARLDATHPPTVSRVAALSARGGCPTECRALPIEWEALERELNSLKRRVEERLVDGYRSSLYD